MVVDSLQERAVAYIAMRVRDGSGNWSAIANVTTLFIPNERPAPVTDLRFLGVSGGLLRFACTATGDDSLTGRATRYDVRFLHRPFTALEFGAIFHRTSVPVGKVSGSVDTFLVADPLPGIHLWVALRNLAVLLDGLGGDGDGGGDPGAHDAAALIRAAADAAPDAPPDPAGPPVGTPVIPRAQALDVARAAIDRQLAGRPCRSR